MNGGEPRTGVVVGGTDNGERVGSEFGAHTPRHSVVLDLSDRPVITMNIVLWFWFT